MFLGTPSFLSPFSILQSGCTDLHAQNIYCEGGGSCRKKTPLYSTTYKTQGNCWMEEIVRPVHRQILRTGTRTNSLVYTPRSPSLLAISGKTLHVPSLGMPTPDIGAVKRHYSVSCLSSMHSNRSNPQNILPGSAKIIFLTPSISRVAKVVGRLWKRKAI